MIGKLLGGVLLAVGGGVLCVGRIKKTRSEIALLQDLSAALENMEAVIRWQKLTLPQAIEKQCSRDASGGYFCKIQDALKSELPLHSVWRQTFLGSEISEIAETCGQMELTGDEVRITGELHLAAYRLRQAAERGNACRSESEKLCVAVCASAVGILTILLM